MKELTIQHRTQGWKWCKRWGYEKKGGGEIMWFMDDWEIFKVAVSISDVPFFYGHAKRSEA